MRTTEITTPREPTFYKDESILPVAINVSGAPKKTPQSIDNTLERIEATLLELKTLLSSLDALVLSERK